MPTASGMSMSNVLSTPQSVREKAGVPTGVVHRSQLDIPSTSAHPVGKRNRYPPVNAATPIVRDVSLVRSRVTSGSYLAATRRGTSVAPG